MPMHSRRLVPLDHQLGGVKVHFGKLYVWVEEDGHLRMVRLPDSYTDTDPDIEGAIRRALDMPEDTEEGEARD